MSQNSRDLEQVVAAARKGAAEAQRQQIEIVKQFAAIDCGTGDEEGNARVVEIIDQQLKLIKGIEITHHYAEGYGIHIVARLKPEQPEGKILLSAHTDTVFHRGDTAAYPYHEDGDTAYGLGIVDCKGGILVAIHAVRIMQEADMLPNKEIVFIFNCDEETGTPTGHAVFDTEIPGAEMAFVFEPSRDEDGVLTARKGACSITVEVFGKKAHSGVNYLDGRSATVELGHMLVRLYENNDNVRGIQFNPAALYGGDYGTGIVSDHATAKVGVRVACQADIDKVKEIISRVEKETYIEGTKPGSFWARTCRSRPAAAAAMPAISAIAACRQWMPLAPTCIKFIPPTNPCASPPLRRRQLSSQWCWESYKTTTRRESNGTYKKSKKAECAAHFYHYPVHHPVCLSGNLHRNPRRL